MSATSEAWTAAQARVWGSGSWQHIADTVLYEVHDELIRRLVPQPGERWLDLATGTGAVALRAARAGALVTAQDLAPGLLETGKKLAAKQGLTVRFDVGDAAQLAYADASFDVVSSAHGIVFATDHAAVAREIARTCRPGGRLGATYWLPNPELAALMERVGYTRPSGADRPRDWADPAYVRGLLADAFELSFAQAVCHWRAESGEAAWRLFVESDGPAKTGVAALPTDAREALHGDWVEYFERHRDGPAVSVPRPYLLVIGRRRAGRASSPSI
jgi:ubiquinone/menaquinone biosynthesis C-methylase UbiE